ncbi:MAG TPA: hypothetical protein VFM54_20720 [Micromonosporaceae bacterium]|nr:hypothetical protein [Micromonosporaceae bacterium]
MAIDSLDAVLDALAATDVATLPAGVQTAQLSRLGRALRRLPAVGEAAVSIALGR